MIIYYINLYIYILQYIYDFICKVLDEGVSLPEKNSRMEVRDEGSAIRRIIYPLESMQTFSGLHNAMFLVNTLNYGKYGKNPTGIHCVKSVFIQSYSGPYFPAFGRNTERYGTSLCIQSECGKMLTRITPNMSTFHAIITMTDNKNFCGH